MTVINDIFSGSIFFGGALTLAAMWCGALLQRKIKAVNPMVFAIIAIIVFLKVFNISYETYDEGAKYISYLLTPVTVALAIPLYRQLNVLKRSAKEIIGGITAGVAASLASVFGLALVFGLTHEEYTTLLPKSVTTAIGMGISEESGGMVTITIAVILITGIIGNIFGDIILKLFRVKDPVAKGVAMGTGAHAFGTMRALQMGETEGAMSSLAVAVAGLITVLGAAVFSNFI